MMTEELEDCAACDVLNEEMLRLQLLVKTLQLQKNRRIPRPNPAQEPLMLQALC